MSWAEMYHDTEDSSWCCCPGCRNVPCDPSAADLMLFDQTDPGR
jgi:hypothetical protein